MTIRTKAAVAVHNDAENSTAQVSNFLSLVLAAALGLGVMTVAGHVQSAILHDAAHDVRHATGFPCH